jgi:hypothetical protein
MCSRAWIGTRCHTFRSTLPDRHHREHSAVAGEVPQVGIEPTTYRLEGEFSRGLSKIPVVIRVLACPLNVAR